MISVCGGDPDKALHVLTSGYMYHLMMPVIAFRC